MVGWTAPLWLNALEKAVGQELFSLDSDLGAVLTFWVWIFSVIFVFGALCFKPAAKLARRELRVLIVNFSLAAFIGGSWLVLLFFGLWNGAETQFAREFAPFERGQIVKIMAAKAGLPTR